MSRWLLALLLLSIRPAVAAPSAQHGTNAPINISADKFVADSNAKSGTWTGNVIVTQGDIRLRANAVRLHVTGKDNKPDKIFANGHVVVDSPNSGTVVGDRAVYDVISHTVTMSGKVVLTRQKDVMRGDRLTVNLETGVATMGSGKPLPKSQGGGRVQGIFTPPSSSSSSSPKSN